MHIDELPEALRHAVKQAVAPLETKVEAQTREIATLRVEVTALRGEVRQIMELEDQIAADMAALKTGMATWSAAQAAAFQAKLDEAVAAQKAKDDATLQNVHAGLSAMITGLGTGQPVTPPATPDNPTPAPVTSPAAGVAPAPAAPTGGDAGTGAGADAGAKTAADPAAGGAGTQAAPTGGATT